MPCGRILHRHSTPSYLSADEQEAIPLKRSFMTSLPDKTGAFLQASRIIRDHGGNMTRASYNKAVDAHMLFLDVEGEEAALDAIGDALSEAGFLKTASHVKIVLAEFELPHQPGATIPILETLAQYRISISYISSQISSENAVILKLGLYIEEPGVIEGLLRELSKICAVRILSYDAGEKKLDNTVCFLTFAGEMRRLLRMTQEQTNEFIYHANLVMQQLDEKGEPPSKTFEYISRFAHFVVDHGGEAYDCRITCQKLTDRVTVTVIEPPCGSNVTILEDGDGGPLLVIDGGFTYYQRLTMRLLRTLFPDFDLRKRAMLITHSDSDHTGISGHFDTVWCSQRTADCFATEHLGFPCPREENPNMLPYYRLSNLITDYVPPQLSRLRILNQQSGDDSEPLSVIGQFSFGDMDFTVLQGNGGHVPGETVLMDHTHKIAITGDDYINIHNCTAPQAEFNRLAPYLARSVNQDSAKYRLILRTLKDMMDGEGWLILPGHGAILQRDQRM